MSNFATGKKSKAISDRSGMAFPYTEMRREWNGSLVHESEFEAKHPQLEPKVKKGDAQGLQNARPARTEPAVAVLLNREPFVSRTAGDENLYIYQPSHNLSVNDVVRFRGVAEEFTSSAPSTSWLTAPALQTATGFTVTNVVDANNYVINPQVDAETFLAANCVPGTTTVYIDMDGVLTNYYQAIAAFNGLTTWFTMTSAMQTATITAQAANFFTNLTKLTRDTGSTPLNNQKTNWVSANLPGALAPTAVLFATNFNKAPYGGANKILIDDTQLYVDQFSGAGGLTYKYWQSPGPMSAGGGLVSAGPVTLTP